MTNWTEGAYGAIVSKHEGWEVRIEPNNRIYVETPHREAEVEVYPEGVWVKGEETSGWHSSAEAFIIPWEAIGAIIEARGIVAVREKASEG